MMKKNLKLFALMTLIFVLGCEKDDEGLIPDEEPQTESNISVENTDVETFEIINVKSSIGNLQDSYSGKFGDTDIQLSKVSDSTLAFVIPDLENGQYELKTDLGNIDFNVSQTVVTNSEEIISNVFTTFDNDVNSMGNSQELDNAITFKNEVAKLYNSLTEEQKKEVAMFYEANKEIFQAFKEDLSTVYNAPTTLARKTAQLDCPKTDFKSFYSCTGNNLGNSISELGGSIKKIAEPIAYAAALGKLASATWYLGPSVWGLTAVGASLCIGTAMYILITEVRPAWINFKSNLTPFLQANWILAKATFDVVTEEFSSDTETDLNLDAKFRTIEETDSDISSETSFFISAYGKLTSTWNDFSEVLGNIPSFTTSEEAVELETNDVTISNISNANVELVSQNGEKIKFKSLTGNEESFSFDITVNKEGFTQTETINAKVLPISSSPPLKLGYYELRYSWETKVVLFHVSNNSGLNSRGDIYYWDSADNTWFNPSFPATFSAAYDQYSNEENIVRVYVSTGGCLSEGFKLENFNQMVTTHNGTYTSARCYLDEHIGSSVNLKYIGEVVTNIK